MELGWVGVATANFGEGEEVREGRVRVVNRTGRTHKIEVQLCCAVGPPGCSIYCGTSTCNNKSNTQKAIRARIENRE